MKIDYNLIPNHMMESINNYVKEGVRLGGFLHAVFSNNLFKSIAHADEENLKLLPIYVSYIHWELPSECHGSECAIKCWITLKEKKK